MKRRNHEHDNQVCLFRWAALSERKHPELALLYAVPNAAKRTPRQGAWMRAEGLKAGVPDLCLPVPRGPYAALYIELKAKGGRLTPAQQDWLEWLAAFGNRAIVCYGWEEAANALERYLLQAPVAVARGEAIPKAGSREIRGAVKS